MGLKLKSTGGTGSVELNAPANHNIDTSFTLPTSNFTGGEWVLADGSGNVNIDSGTLYVDAVNDRVGIGESNPSAGLHVVTDVNPVLKLDRGTANTANANWYYNGTLTGQVSAANTDFQISAAGASTPMSFYVNGSPRAKIDTSGRFMVGPTSSLNSECVFQTHGNTIRDWAIKYTGTSGNAETGIRWLDKNNFVNAQISNSLQNDGLGAQAAHLVFKTATGGTLSERLQIASNGFIFPDASSAQYSSSYKSTAVGGLRWIASSSTTSVRAESYATTTNTRYHKSFSNPNGVVGSISTVNSTTSFNTSSDYRLKENVVNIDDGIARVKQLQPRRFNFIVDTDLIVDGFIAHEVQNIVPEAVTGEKDAVRVWEEDDDLPDGVSVGDSKLDDDGNTIPEYQGIDQSKLVPLLTAALQEAIAKIETLEANNVSLEARLAALEGGTTE